MTWCLPSYLADQFLAKIKDGTITPEKMIEMTSAERREFFSEFMGEENARQANTLLESKLILKNQQAGIVTWAKKISGITPEAERTLVARVNKMTDVLTPKTEDAFLEDLAAHALGTTVTMEEAGNITGLAKEVSGKQAAMEAGQRRTPLGKPTETELEYGRALVAFDNYVSALKQSANGDVRQQFSDKFKEYKENPFRVLGDGLKLIGDTSRSVRASLDNSFIGRQGRNLLFKGITGDFKAGKAWMDTFVASHKVIWETFKGNGPMIMDEIRAEILSDPDYPLIRKAKVATSVIEEEMPADWFTKIPYLGKPFEASNNSFMASAHLLRYKTAKYYLEKARQIGTDLGDKTQLEGIGNLVNSLTGRGEFGKSDKPGIINSVLFSPRMIRADFDIVTAHVFDSKSTAFTRKEAAKNLMRIIAAQAVVLATAKLLDDKSVDLDPRSADFGKIKIGNTRFDISGGVGVLVRLAARLAPLILYQDASIKNAEGELVKINTGKYGERTGLDIFEDYIENKSAPLFSVFLSHLEGKYPFTKEKPTPLGDIRELATPFPIDTAMELLDDDKSADFLISMIAQSYGVSIQTYENSSFDKVKDKKNELSQTEFKKPWDDLTSKQQQDILGKHPEIGDLERKIKSEDLKGEIEGSDRINSKLSKEVRNALDDLAIQTGVSRKIDNNFVLNSKRFEKYQDLSAEYIQVLVGPFVKNKEYDSLTGDQKEALMRKAVDTGRSLARKKLMELIDSGSL